VPDLHASASLLAVRKRFRPQPFQPSLKVLEDLFVGITPVDLNKLL